MVHAFRIIQNVPDNDAAAACGKMAPTIVVQNQLVKVVIPVALPRSRNGNISAQTTVERRAERVFSLL
jgi:hypothetical protein